MKTTNKIVNEIAKICKAKHYALATVESCTGGGVAFAIVMNSHASSHLERSFVAYSNASKHAMLNIPTYQLQANPLVSKTIAIQMAENGLKESHAQICIATTGVEQESANTPGLIWIACAGINMKTVASELRIKGDREIFTERSVAAALKQLLSYIQ